MKPKHPEVESLAVQQTLFCVMDMDTGEVLAIVEAACQAEASERAASVLKVLGLGSRKNVQAFPTPACLAGVPTFMESFFLAGPHGGTLH
jgi:hypothetical protein